MCGTTKQKAPTKRNNSINVLPLLNITILTFFSIPSRYMLCNNIWHWPCNMVIFNVCPFVVWLLTTILEETFLSLEWSRLDRWRLSLDLDLSLLDFFVLSTGLCRSGDRLCLLRTWLSGLLRLDGVVRSSESLPSVVLLCLLLFWEGWVTTETRLLITEVELSPSSRTVFGLGSLGAAVVSGYVLWAASVVLEWCCLKLIPTEQYPRVNK